MKKFEKYIYIGDIHGEKIIIDFFEKNNDGKTMFILMGDIFDRGKYSFEVFIKIKELYEQGVLKAVLGNHDLFFIFSHLSNLHKQTYKEQFLRNGGKQTLKSFRKNIQYKDNWKDHNIGRALVDVSQWLLNNFDIYYIDPLNNLTLHGGIPVLFDGTIVGEKIDNKYVKGVEYIKVLNKKLKEFDEETLRKFTGICLTDNIINDINKNNNTNHKMPYNYKNEYDLFIPTWFRSKYYLADNNMLSGIKKELKDNNLNKLILGHDFATKNTSNIDNTIYRLDMRIGILILDSNNKEIDKFIL